MAKLGVLYGPVSSGKTQKLIETISRSSSPASRRVVVKSVMDTRTTHTLSSPDPGLNGRVPAMALGSLYHLVEFAVPGVELVAIDDAQFFELPETVEVAKRLKALPDCQVLVAGRDRDHVGQPYLAMRHWIEAADSPDSCMSRCARCGRDAAFSYLCVDPGLRIVVVGSSMYEPRCEACFGLQIA